MTIMSEDPRAAKFQPITRFVVGVKTMARHLIDKRTDRLTDIYIQQIPEKQKVDLGLGNAQLDRSSINGTSR